MVLGTVESSIIFIYAGLTSEVAAISSFAFFDDVLFGARFLISFVDLAELAIEISDFLAGTTTLRRGRGDLFDLIVEVVAYFSA